MEAQQSNSFQSPETPNIDPGKTTFQSECPAEQNPETKHLPIGYVYMDNEELKQFYLAFAPKLCTSITPEHSELQQLRILYTRIKRTCKLLTVLSEYPWSEVSPLLMKACGFFLFMDGTSSTKDKRKLNNLLYMQTNVMAKMTEYHDLIAHDLLFFSRVKNDLMSILNIGEMEEDAH